MLNKLIKYEKKTLLSNDSICTLPLESPIDNLNPS